MLANREVADKASQRRKLLRVPSRTLCREIPIARWRKAYRSFWQS